MGLNPPFGVNGNLANKFIDKALTFKPKLIILIVPSLTERSVFCSAKLSCYRSKQLIASCFTYFFFCCCHRLDRKRKLPYDIIWEDQCLLSGKV